MGVPINISFHSYPTSFYFVLFWIILFYFFLFNLRSPFSLQLKITSVFYAVRECHCENSDLEELEINDLIYGKYLCLHLASWVRVKAVHEATSGGLVFPC